ncbi:DUF721 domain-containing protein [Desulfococcaceae bacterium OttesenSCG-928-F15]|nr:DUF721 domain-containing protein [Desulfococcaceae bacterium OttesenSCG-928-F15]
MKAKRPNNRQFSPLGPALEKTLKPFRDRYGKGEFRELWMAWPEAVGPEIAKNTKPLSFRDGCLLVSVANSSWMQHLQYHKEVIRERMNSAHGTKIIQDIRFKIGAL